MSTKIEHKNILAELLDAADESGSFEAIIATFGVADSDGDVIEKGAFGDATVAILPAHDNGSVPLGKAKIEERDDHAVAVGRFNLDVAAARDWHKAIKFDLENPPAIQEWSWGFFPAEWHVGEHNGEQVRFLSEVDTMEVSPVLRGASVGTRTLSAKERRERQEEDQDGADSTVDDGTQTDVDDSGSDDDTKVKLVDQIRLAREMAEAAASRVGELAESRANQGKHVGDEAMKEFLQLGSEVEGLAHVCEEIHKIASSPEAAKMDEKARALADYMAHRARWAR